MQHLKESLGVYKDLLERYKIPTNKPILTGSASMALMGIRDVNDLDILIDDESFDWIFPEVARRAGYRGVFTSSQYDEGSDEDRRIGTYNVGDVKLSFMTSVPRKMYTFDEVSFHSYERDGFRWMSMSQVLRIKARARRPKDLRDLKRAEDHQYIIPPPPKGTLRIWHISNPPRDAFRMEVKSPEEAVVVLRALTGYDNYLGDKHIFANVCGLQNFDGEEWCDWHGSLEEGKEDEEYEDIWEYASLKGLD